MLHAACDFCWAWRHRDIIGIVFAASFCEFTTGDFPPFSRCLPSLSASPFSYPVPPQNFPLLDKFETCSVSRIDSSQIIEEKKGSEEISDENIQAVEDSVDDFPSGSGDSADGLQEGIPEDLSNRVKASEDRRVMRGDPTHPKNMRDGGAVLGNGSSVIKILALISVIAILVQLYARRRKSKQAEKSV